MHWMWGAAGLAAAIAAVAIFRFWSRKSKAKNHAEISLIAVVETIQRQEDGRPVMSFVDQNRKQYRFVVPDRVAQELRPGQQGVLTYCDGEFVYFVRKEELLYQQQRIDRVS